LRDWRVAGKRRWCSARPAFVPAQVRRPREAAPRVPAVSQESGMARWRARWDRGRVNNS
jgi:hypothetical protein